MSAAIKSGASRSNNVRTSFEAFAPIGRSATASVW